MEIWVRVFHRPYKDEEDAMEACGFEKLAKPVLERALVVYERRSQQCRGADAAVGWRSSDLGGGELPLAFQTDAGVGTSGVEIPWVVGGDAAPVAHGVRSNLTSS